MHRRNKKEKVMEAYKRLKEHHIGRTQPRVAILEYLMSHHTHPSVDTIYKDLSSANPKLSRTTVYNTVKLLSERGAVTLLSIDEHNICVDGETKPHAHLLCKQCGKIIDVPINKNLELKMIDGNLVQETHLYYRGICSECLEKDDDDETGK